MLSELETQDHTQVRPSRAFPIVISGPSGVGKSTLVEALLAGDRCLRLAVSATTRAARAGEVDGRDYHFVSEEEFARQRAAGAFVEHAEVHGHWYGTLSSELDDWLQQDIDVLLDVDYQGERAIDAAYPESISLFVLPPSLEHLEARLRGRRSDSEATIARRLAKASREMAEAGRYDYAVVNSERAAAIARVRAIVTAERQRVTRLKPEALAIFGVRAADPEA